MDSNLPGPSVHEILQAKIMEWVAMPSSRGSFWHRLNLRLYMSPALAGGFLIPSATWEAPWLL